MKEDNLKCSLRIQLDSVILFANRLGYDLSSTKKGVTFIRAANDIKEHRTISLHNMVILHNQAKDIETMADAGYLSFPTISAGVHNEFKIPTYWLAQAVASKLVDIANVYVDKNGQWATGKTWVKFVNNSEPVYSKYLGAAV